MQKLSDFELIEAYELAKKMNLNEKFIALLKIEIKRRGL